MPAKKARAIGFNHVALEVGDHLLERPEVVLERHVLAGIALLGHRSRAYHARNGRPRPFREDGGVGQSTLLLVCAPYLAVAVAYLEARRREETPPRWARLAGLATVVLHLAALVWVGAEMGRSPFRTSSQALSSATTRISDGPAT